MRRMSYGTNSIYHTASIYFTYGPWWSFWLDYISSWLCSLVPALPLGAEWGDLGQWYHARVNMPISHWCWRHQDLRSVEIDYRKLKEALFGRDTKHWERESNGET